MLIWFLHSRLRPRYNFSVAYQKAVDDKAAKAKEKEKERRDVARKLIKEHGAGLMRTISGISGAPLTKKEVGLRWREEKKPALYDACCTVWCSVWCTVCVVCTMRVVNVF